MQVPLITLLRLGDLNRYISHAVIVGFTLGAAVLIVLDQVKNLFESTSQGSGTGDEHFLRSASGTRSSHIDQTHMATLLVGLGTRSRSPWPWGFDQLGGCGFRCPRC